GHAAAEPGFLEPATNSAAATIPGEVRGTPAYLSPEQAEGQLEAIGPATDVFGLGATLYTLLTGASPYGESSPERAVSQAREASFTAPRQRNPHAPAALEAICLKAMATRPGDRYATPLELARDVENWLAGERVRAWREPWHVGLRREVPRRQTPVPLPAL